MFERKSPPRRGFRFIGRFIAAAFVAAQVSFAQPAEYMSEGKVTVETKLSSAQAVAGTTIKAAVILTIAPEWHINSHMPSESYLIGTEFTPSFPSSFILSDIRYPEGHIATLGFSDKPLSVYDSVVTIFASVRVAESAAPGEYTLRGTLTVQSCDNSVCLAPSDIEIAIPLSVIPAGSPATETNKEVFESYDAAAPQSQSKTENEFEALIREKGYLTAFIAIFLIGLALNLTPCVYPMLTVTVSLFGGQKDTNTVRVFFKALVYVLGIATMYSALGVTAALTGGFFGAWLQSPWVLGGIAVILFALALSQFGLYTIQAPYWLTSKLGGTTGTGFAALYFSGLVVGIFAAPCVGPAVIALLTFVSSLGDPVFAFWSFFVLAMGLGLPYLILGTFSGLLSKLPRSGGWLLWVEHIFGVALVTAALFYGALALAPKYSVWIVPVALVLGGMYLGFVDPSGKEKKGLRYLKWAFGIIAVAGGTVMANGLRAETIVWEPYSAVRLAEAKAEGKPVIIDFYADWCIPCQELDRITYADPRVMKAADSFVRLKADLTHFDSPESNELRKQYDVGGVPTVVVLDSQGNEVTSARTIGFVNADTFLERLSAAK